MLLEDSDENLELLFKNIEITDLEFEIVKQVLFKMINSQNIVFQTFIIE